MPDGSNTGNPENHKEAGDIDWHGDTIIVAAEDFDGEVDE